MTEIGEIRQSDTIGELKMIINMSWIVWVMSSKANFEKSGLKKG